MDWNNLYNEIKSFFLTNIWNILGFFAILIVGLILVKIIINILRRLIGKTKMEKITQNFIMAFVKFFLYLILLLLLLSSIGIQITGILTTLSALVLAVGMALQNILANVANGIIIVSTHIFKKGDFVEINGVSGSVNAINFLFVTITTVDNKKITIPNSSIINNEVVNYGANPTRRVDFTFSVAYESDIELIKKIVLDVMYSDGRVLTEPNAPFCRLKNLGSSSIDFFANCWCDNEDYWDVYYYIIENVFNEFKRNNISIPFNQLEIRNRIDIVEMPVIETPLQERTEKIRDQGKHKFNLETDDLGLLLKKKKIKKKNKKEKKNNN